MAYIYLQVIITVHSIHTHTHSYGYAWVTTIIVYVRGFVAQEKFLESFSKLHGHRVVQDWVNRTVSVYLRVGLDQC